MLTVCCQFYIGEKNQLGQTLDGAAIFQFIALPSFPFINLIRIL
jgi:hypothetical protein